MAKGFGARCMVDGGKVAGPKGIDKVPLQGTAGEYMLPIATVNAVGGAPVLDELVRQTNGKEPGPRMVRDVMHAVDGGLITAGNGVLDAIKSLLGFGATAKPTQEQRPVPARVVTPAPELLGAGMAASAATDLRDRQRKIDEAAGYADGGEVLDYSNRPREDASMLDTFRGVFGVRPGGAYATEPAAPVFGAGVSFADRLRGAVGVPAGGFGARTQATAAPSADATWRPRMPVEHLQAEPLDRTTENAQRAAWGAKPLPEPAAPAAPAPQSGARATTPNMQAPELPPMPMQVKPTGYKNTAATGSLASFFGAAMNQKQIATAEAIARQKDEANAQRAQQDKQMAAGAQGKTPESIKTALEAERIRQILDLAGVIKDPQTKAALLLGQAPPAKKYDTPMAVQPPPGNGPQIVVFTDPQAGVAFQAPVQQRAQMRRGSDGKVYVMGADGSPMREATQDEVAAAQE